MFVTQKQLAECFGVSLRRVQQLQTQGVIHRDQKSNGYDLAECNRAYIDHKVQSASVRKSAETKEELQAQHERVKIQISKERLRRIRRESLDAKAVEETWMNWLTFLRGQLENLPERIAMAIAGEDTNTQIKTIEKIIKDLEKNLREYDPGDYEDGSTDEYLEEDEEEEEDDW